MNSKHPCGPPELFGPSSKSNQLSLDSWVLNKALCSSRMIFHPGLSFSEWGWPAPVIRISLLKKVKSSWTPLPFTTTPKGLCQSVKQARVCLSEVQGSSSIRPAPDFSGNRNLSFHDHYVWGGLQPSHLPQILHSQPGSFPSCLTHQLYQEVTFHRYKESPRLLHLCCILFPADFWKVEGPHKSY